MKKIFASIVLLAGAAVTVSANSIFNGSFELGTDGFALRRDLRVDTNPRLEFIPLKTVPGAPQSGEKALLFSNPFAENYWIFSKEFKLKPSTKYRFSFKGKSASAGERVNFAVFKIDPQWSAQAEVFRLTPEWKSYEYTLETDSRAGYYHVRIRPAQKDTLNANDLFFDDLRIEEIGKHTTRINAIAVPDKNLYFRGENAILRLKVTQPGKEAYSGQITVTAKDEYTGKILFRETVPVTLQGGETKTIPLKTRPQNRYGATRLLTEGKHLQTHDSFFVTIGKYEPKPFDINKDFVVGFNGGMGYIQPPQTKYPAYQAYNAPLEKCFELIHLAGGRILRDHNGGVRGVDWPAVEWERGKFDFRHLDRLMKIYEKYHITLFPVIGDGFIDNHQSWQPQKWPPWVIPLSQRITDDLPSHANPTWHVVLPPEDLFRNYVFQTAKHLKGRVPVYEITNEPNLYLQPKYYSRYLAIAAEAIRAADPAAKISGFCLTSDFGAKSDEWLKACVQLGAMKYVDNVGFHPYAGRELGSVHPADAYIAALRKELAAYGKPDMPIWNTELYYLADSKDGQSGYERNLCEAHHNAWRFLTDLGEGTVQSIAIPVNHLWKTMLTPNALTEDNFNEWIPSEKVVVYNTMARLFEGGKVVRKIRYPNSVICYVFRKDGKLIAALWNYRKRNGVIADLFAFQVMDLFGNEEKPGEKTIGAMPYYLTPGKLSDAEFLKKLEHLLFRLDRPVDAGEIARRIGDTLYVMLHNDSAEVQSGVLGVTHGGLTAKKPVQFTLPPHTGSTIEIPVKTVKPNGKKTELMFFINGTAHRIPVQVVENKEFGRKFSLKNADGVIAFTKDEIKLEMHVRDTTDAGATGKRDLWRTDCVELFFDTAPMTLPPHHAQAYTPQTFRLFITPRDAQKIHTAGNIRLSDCKLDMKQSTNGYSFLLRIAVRTGKLLGFDVKINDADGNKVVETSLGNGKKLHENRCNFSIVR